MSFGIASHGGWCGSRTYPTRCRHCSEKVFYFECRCGCKVFFSELGQDVGSGLAYCHKRQGLILMATGSKSIMAVGDEFIEIEGKKLRALKVAM